MSYNPDRREFERFLIDFPLVVFAEDIEGKKIKDRCVLKNVSGSGAQFFTQQYDIYFPGQLLDITIFLPKTSEVEAHMQTKATVIRVDRPADSEKKNKNRGCGIAVRFNTRLNFERI